jgi:hypothetical protein
MKRVFYAKINPTDYKVIFENRKLFDDYTKELCGSKETRLEITVKKWIRKRTNNQNAYYWACLNVVSKETGESSDVLHNTFKAMFLKKQIKIKDKIINVVGSTTGLDSLGLVEYMDKIGSFLADFGIILPNPDDYKYGEN